MLRFNFSKDGLLSGFSVEASTPDEATRDLGAIRDGSILGHVAAAVTTAREALAELQISAPTSAARNPNVGGVDSGTGIPLKPQPAGPPAKCKHGDMRWISKVKAGKDYAWGGWFCPADRDSGDQCEPIFGKAAEHAGAGKQDDWSGTGAAPSGQEAPTTKSSEDSGWGWGDKGVAPF
jgi:hypothetical protein